MEWIQMCISLTIVNTNKYFLMNFRKLQALEKPGSYFQMNTYEHLITQ